jgi:D-arabinose 1-dehydrogenase-like Zn-dependent alcohol dehydrogenase
MKSLKPGGIVVISGATSGDATAAELQRLFFLQLRVVGSTMGTRDELSDLLAFCAQADIHPRIGSTIPLTEAEIGLRAMLDGNTDGKIAFTN